MQSKESETNPTTCKTNITNQTMTNLTDKCSLTQTKTDLSHDVATCLVNDNTAVDNIFHVDGRTTDKTIYTKAKMA